LLSTTQRGAWAAFVVLLAEAMLRNLVAELADALAFTIAMRSTTDEMSADIGAKIDWN